MKNYQPLLLFYALVTLVIAIQWPMLALASMENHFCNTMEYGLQAIPVFWHCPKSGGTSMQDLAHCLHLVVAAQTETSGGYPASVDVLQFSDGRSFVNVDVSTKAGIQQAQDLGFSTNHLEEVLLTSHLNDAAEKLLNDEHPGALFALLRHPVERAVSLYYYLQHASWEPTYAPELKNTTLMDYYATGRHVERNWMTRYLTGKETGELGREDVEYAKQLVTQKMLVGLTDHMETSLRRFGAYFGWDRREKWDDCLSHFSSAGSNSYEHPHVRPGSPEWEVIVGVNDFDMELYMLAVQLFEDQESIV